MWENQATGSEDEGKQEAKLQSSTMHDHTGFCFTTSCWRSQPLCKVCILGMQNTQGRNTHCIGPWKRGRKGVYLPKLLSSPVFPWSRFPTGGINLPELLSCIIWPPGYQSQCTVTPLWHFIQVQKLLGTDEMQPKIWRGQRLTVYHFTFFPLAWNLSEVPFQIAYIANRIIIHKKQLYRLI